MTEIDEKIFSDNKLYPGCVSTSGSGARGGRQSKSYKYHSGWSTPPTVSYIQQYAPLYLGFYDDFQKQWHYKMEETECRDPNPLNDEIFSSNVMFPTDTYYPPGLICAKEFQRQFCPTSGESGRLK